PGSAFAQTEEPTGIDAEPQWEGTGSTDEGDGVAAAFFLDLWPNDELNVAERFAASRPEWSLLEEHLVSEAMSRSVCSVPQDLEVSAAAQRMLAAGALRAIVTGDDDVVGILTATDILRAVAEHRLTVREAAVS